MWVKDLELATRFLPNIPRERPLCFLRSSEPRFRTPPAKTSRSIGSDLDNRIDKQDCLVRLCVFSSGTATAKSLEYFGSDQGGSHRTR